jgi:hypothetical protein
MLSGVPPRWLEAPVSMKNVLWPMKIHHRVIMAFK